MAHDASPIPSTELQSLLDAHRFHHHVFVLPPWEAIYVTDSERDHSFSHASRVHTQLVSWYGSCGYVLHELPRLPASQRAQQVIRVLYERGTYPHIEATSSSQTLGIMRNLYAGKVYRVLSFLFGSCLMAIGFYGILFAETPAIGGLLVASCFWFSDSTWPTRHARRRNPGCQKSGRCLEIRRGRGSKQLSVSVSPARASATESLYGP